MKKAEIYKLMDLIEDVKKLDELISLHRQADTSDFMISQYEAKKTKLMGILIDELASPPVQSTQSYLLIKMLLNKYYPAKSELDYIVDSDISKLAAAI
ncbi:hypothetical protein [Mucilaginibacter gotjawali]|uniref:Uncharacterized protein n=2 Tax=Mucilaginibacter gotjawali TaxID=1550579 RepID=A0A110B1U6_9SPHI|nr:hypothetical protein [Mucilaginibacter gotjawali]MBB3057323.1 hypothetical protein [Mucilaginibacter gotjawali]BAU52911.1 hypothetical protein MgSA37_01075 [Mucilaginibacter gotjawali]